VRLPAGVLVALIAALPGLAQYVPPVPTGFAGTTRVGDRPIPLPSPELKWIRATSPNFTVISSASETRTREIAELLETVAGALGHVHPRFDARFSDTTVYVFSRRRDSQAYFDLLLNQNRTNAAGAFVSHADGSAAMIVDSARTLATNKVVKHELMHNILAASGTRLPLWLEEGIAEYFSTTEIRGDRVIVGRPIVSHAMHLRTRTPLPMSDVLSASTDSAITKHAVFYPQVWALVDWMMRAGRGEFYAFVSDVEQGADVSEAFRRRFTIELDTVARSFRTNIARPSASSTLQIEKKPVAVTTAPMTTADALSELAIFLGQIGATRDDAEEHLRTAMELEAGHARARSALATIRTYQRRHPEAMELFEEALRLDPDDPAIKLAFATALLGRAIGPFAGAFDLPSDATSRFHRARELASAALAAEPTPLAEAIVGTSYLADDDVRPGIPHLERARQTRPARLDYALNLYALYLRTDRRDDAAALFAESFERSRHPQVAFVARAVYVRESIRKANDLILEERLDEAADMVQKVADDTSDPQAKGDLTRQVAELRRLAGSNREIELYNRAVAAYNERQIAEALEILESLLDSATDAEVRQRAEQLRTTVRKRLGGM
jgi:tetratricopeptide (TPR) repeat protein